MKRIIVLGAGFAGLWTAVGAARQLDELGICPERVEVLVVNRTRWHDIRVRNYEADLSENRVLLDDVLDPVGVRHIEGEILDIDTHKRSVKYSCHDGYRELSYDRLVFALGSRIACPSIPGLASYGFDIDTHESATRLNGHIAALPFRQPFAGQYSIVVVGGGLTGVEAAAEMFGKLRAALAAIPALSSPARPRVIIVDRQPWIGSDMGAAARPLIAEALGSLGVEMKCGISLVRVDERGVTLSDGERLEAGTVVWCAGMKAHPMTAQFPVALDRLGRLPVDNFLRITGMSAEFAAGDAAWLPIDGTHPSVMSCQHARPMGRYAGHNVVCDLLGKPMLPLSIDWYTTILDLGPWGALYTEGWERRVVSQGAVAKRAKEVINRQRIYPPRSRNRRELLEAATPVIQAPPSYGGAAT